MPGAATSRPRSSPFCVSAATNGPAPAPGRGIVAAVRPLLIKDLRILRRSPLVVGLLVVYPVLISLLVGFALSRGPSRPRVALLSEVPAGQGSFQIGDQSLNASSYASNLFQAVDPVKVSSRAEAVDAVRSGRALGALIIPPDIAQKLNSGVERPTLEVIYSAENPLKRNFVQSVIKSRLADANSALATKFAGVALGYIDLLEKGGQVGVFGRTFDVLGLTRSKQILDAAIATLPRGSPAAAALGRVDQFARLALENLTISNRVIGTLSQPIQIRETVLQGATGSTNAFGIAVAVTVSLAFICVLLGAGMLALEREENAIARLARGLVALETLVVEKVLLCAGCAGTAALVMLVGLGAFGGIAWDRAPLWILALAAGAMAFGALGVALGALAREVRAASLLAFALVLPLAVLALIPSGTVSSGLYAVITVVDFAFPVRPALDALAAALQPTDQSLLGPLVHLAVLVVVLAAIGRAGLARFARQ